MNDGGQREEAGVGSGSTASIPDGTLSALAPPPAAAAADTGNVDVQMQQVLQLMSARTRGKVSNEEVEKAVSQVLSLAGMGAPASGSLASSSETMNQTAKQKAPPDARITLDTEDYDFDEDDNDTKQEGAKEKQENTQEKQKPLPPTKKREIAPPKYDYDHIPMGQQGAKMMTAFGDGEDPHPDVVSATLLGARRLLQVTIQDARALRRKAKQQFLRARADVAKDYTSKKTRDAAAAKALKYQTTQQQDNKHDQQQRPQEVADPSMLYRAMSGHDKLAYDPKCGFDYDQLKALFPEEMTSYARWNTLRDEYAAQTDEKEVASAAVEKDDNKKGEEDIKEKSIIDPKEDPGKDGGHLVQRAIQFDIRTENMDKSWYMKFSEHRKGSFLPRRLKQEGDSEWEKNRKAGSQRGKQEAGVWSKMPANSARFLHWVGFDLDKGLPPPNEETTNALGFLGYDFFGRIVEKAIFLKNLEKAKAEDGDVDERRILLELHDGEQLELGDVKRAIDDPDIKPAAMYTAESTGGAYHKPAAQLYFGPGFEERLEMELDEIVCGNTNRADLPEEESKIRQVEDKLFADIAGPPSTDNALMVLLGKEGNDDDNDNSVEEAIGLSSEKGTSSCTPKSQPKPRGRPRKIKAESEGVVDDQGTPKSQSKKRGRPRKIKAENEGGVNDKATPTSQPKKRGRPRKIIAENDGGANDKNNPKNQPKKRGRPRKNQTKDRPTTSTTETGPTFP